MNYAELNKMSLEDLRALNEKVIEVINLKKHEIALDVKDQISVGSSVVVNHPQLAGKNLRVKKINRTKAVLDVINELGNRVASYTVPLSMIEVK